MNDADIKKHAQRSAGQLRQELAVLGRIAEELRALGDASFRADLVAVADDFQDAFDSFYGEVGYIVQFLEG